MLYLASSSPTRALLLTQGGIKFERIICDFDESCVLKTKPATYVSNVVEAKFKQFFDKFNGIYPVLFADSCVSVGDKILGKASDEKHARAMLELQSGAMCFVYTAMILAYEGKKFSNLSATSYKFDKFQKDDLDDYLQSDKWRGKAGAMSIEGFNKKYILSQHGNTSTAMGLNVEILKRFIW